MKKVLLVLVCAASMTALKAQVSIGAKAGLNISKIAGPDANGYNSKAGFYAGGFANVPVVENFSVQPELLFSLQGAKYKNFGEGKATANLSYLNIPVMARYTAKQGFFGETGPQLGFLLSAKAKQGGEKEDIKEGLRKVDFTWAFGAGYVLPSGLGFNARFNLGLSKLDDQGSAKARNNVFQVGAFYTLN